MTPDYLAIADRALAEYQAKQSRELPAVLNQWRESLRELYEERAAIMEYDGRLSRQEAEVRAEADIRRRWREQEK